MLEVTTTKKEIYGLCLPNGKQLLAKLFVDDSLMYLKVEKENLRKALEIVHLSATISGSQCNIEKSRLISLAKNHNFDYTRWNGELVRKGNIF